MRKGYRFIYGNKNTSEIIGIDQIPDDSDILLVTDSQDTAFIREMIPYYLDPQSRRIVRNELDSFFVDIQDGDYARAWGFDGTIPYLWKQAIRIV